MGQNREFERMRVESGVRLLIVAFLKGGTECVLAWETGRGAQFDGSWREAQLSEGEPHGACEARG